MEAWQKLLEGELDDLLPHIQDDLENGEFEMTYSTFIGPDGITEITYKHGDSCDCQECDTARWERIEREQTRSKAQAAIAIECRIADQQATLQAAWQDLQATSSYVERFVLHCVYCEHGCSREQLVCCDVAYDEQGQEVPLYTCQACSRSIVSWVFRKR